MIKEIYKGYYVDENGNVYSQRKSNYLKLLKNHTMKYGYKKVWLYINGEKKMKFVHRLVAEAFIPNKNDYPMINHKDSNPSNNKLENLEWCDASYNQQYSWKYNNRKPYTGVKDNGWNKYHKEWELLNKKGMSYRKIAEKYGTTHHTVIRTIRKMKGLNHG